MSDLQIAFRETVLWRLSRPGGADVLRRFGDLFVDLLNESGSWGTDPSADSLRAELRAVTADLAYIYGDLERLAEEVGRGSGDGEDHELADRVSGWVGRLALILADMQRQLPEPE